MARKWRVEFAQAFYHVICRGFTKAWRKTNVLPVWAKYKTRSWRRERMRSSHKLFPSGATQDLPSDKLWVRSISMPNIVSDLLFDC
jgi:hypothetical protein